MRLDDFHVGLFGFLDSSPTPFHATANMVAMLQNAGFKRLYEELPWDLEEGKKYFVVRNNTSLVAFTYPNKKEYTIIGAHTDSPTFRLKPNPILVEHGVVKLAVEPYGGMLLAPWFDRDLSIAGEIHYLDKNNIIQRVLVDYKDPIVVIPSLAIHLDEKANKEKTYNKQTDMMPILQSQDDISLEDFLAIGLQKSNIQEYEEIYGFDLRLYDTQKASYVGLKKEFFTSARIDNLISCYVGLLAICSVENTKPFMFVANDHEEVGSETVEGASGNFFESVYKRIFPSYEAYIQSVRSSFLISCDNAHAIHPNFPSKHEPSHAPKMNAGVVIKINANQRYATSAKTMSRFMNVASALGYKTQSYVTRSDMGCGSTIGPITAKRIGIDTIDVGVPTLAMHSIREMAGIKDAYELYNIVVAI